MVTTACFDFASEFPQNWQSCLQKIKNQKNDEVISRVYWGLHETSPGIRDFSKSSKLKIEKFLQTAASVNLKVQLIFGFMPSQHTFPLWLKNLNLQKTLVPAFEWDGISGPWFLTEVPCLEEKKLQEAFLSFFQDALSFLSLYREPEGPLTEIHFDFGVYHYSESITDNGSFSRWLEKQYGTIANLNQKYQTAFNHFSSAGSKTGFRVLLDRRPWLACFDYKNARNSHLNLFREKIAGLSTDFPIKIRPASPSTRNSDWKIRFDGVYVEEGKDIYPFSPQAMVLPQAVLGYRYLKRLTSSMPEWDFASLPLWDEADEIHKNQVVICGKYLSRACIQGLKKNLETGSQIIFPFGVPQFDENMQIAELDHSFHRETYLVSPDLKIQIQKTGQGEIIFPEPLFQLTDDFKPKIETIVGALKEKGAIR